MNRIFKPIILLFTIIVLSVPAQLQAQDNPEVTVPELQEHVKYLASDELEGRKPGKPGGLKAAEYVRTELEKLGLTLLGDNGYQYFEIVAGVETGKNNSLTFGDFSGMVKKDFIPVSFSESIELTAPVVFAGYGFDIDEDDMKWNDFDGVDVENNWVMVLRGDPDNNPHNSNFATYNSLRKKMLNARDNNAGGVLFVSGMEFDPTDELIELRFDRSQTSAGIPVVHITRDVANKILASSGKTVSELEAALNETHKPNSFDTGESLTVNVDLKLEKRKVQNVAAELKAEGPLADEYIIIGAHFDHLGYGGPGSGSRRPDLHEIHNGADDNASGTSTMLELAEKVAANKDKFKRSVLFLGFDAEEMGLIGSKYYVDNPLIDLSKVTFMFNFDMMGSLNEDNPNIAMGGVGTAVGLQKMVEVTARTYGVEIEGNPDGHGPSDHASFYAKDIPVLFFFTGATEEYHTPADDYDMLNYEGMVSIAGLGYELIEEIANLDDRLTFKESGPKKSTTRMTSLKVTMGIMPNYAGGTDGMRVDAVIPNRPASEAGMEKGDVIVAMDDKEVKDIYDYMNRLGEYKPGDKVKVDVLRNGEKVTLEVEF